MANFPFRIVGFDLDGTLLDTHADLGMALNHVLTGIGRPAIPLPDVARLVGGGTRVLLERGLDRTGGREGVEFEVLQAALLDYYEANIAVHTRLFPGGGEALDLLESHGVALALVTNKMERLAVRLLDELGLTSRFALILGGDTLGPGRGKPAPDLLLEMVARLGGGPAAYVGDTTYDTRAARAANIPCACFMGGFADAPPAELGADALFPHFAELAPVLEGLGPR